MADVEENTPDDTERVDEDTERVEVEEGWKVPEVAGDDAELENVAERFRTAYLTSCERNDAEPLESVLEQLENANASGETFFSIQVRGNTPEHFKSRLKDGDLEAIVGALQASPGVLINELDLSWNLIGDQSVTQLCEYLKTDEQIVTVNLAYNEIGEDGAKAIADALSVNRTVRHLILSGNKVGDNGGLALAEMMLKNYSLRTAEFGNMDLGHKTLTMLGTVLKNEEFAGAGSDSNLEVLNLDRPLLFSCQEEAIEQLAMGLRLNVTLRKLSMKNASLRDRGCYLLCDNLVLNGCLQELDLSSNKLTEDAGVPLATLVEKNQGIETLYLANNQLCDRGCTALSEALAGNPQITDVDLAHNRIESDGLLQLASAVQKHGELCRLRAWGNELEPQSTAALAYACQHLKTLRDCDILCQIVDDVPNAVRKITPESYFVPGKV